jgi:hypothetical protein
MYVGCTDPGIRIFELDVGIQKPVVSYEVEKSNFGPIQGCQMVCFQTKNSNLGKFFRALEWKRSLYFIGIGNIFRSFGIIYGRLV